MAKFFWGFFLIYLHFNLSFNGHTLNILPPFVGYWLLYQGLTELDGESGLFRNIRPFAVGMAVYTGVLWCGDLLGVEQVGDWKTLLGVILSLLGTVVSLYVSWAIIQGVRDMENSRGVDLNGAGMQRAWWVLVIAQAASFILTRLLSVLTFAAMAVGLVGIAMMLLALWEGQKRWESTR